jgi:hypothetical protein
MLELLPDLAEQSPPGAAHEVAHRDVRGYLDIVWSWYLLERVQAEAFWIACSAFADVFVGCEAAQGLELSAVVVCGDEVVEVGG